MTVDLITLREALESSWDDKTSYQGMVEEGNPSRGQCYPTSHVVQHFFPEMDIIKGKVWNGKEIEGHFWNALVVGGKTYHIDLTWQQFPPGSSVQSFRILDRNKLDDSESTIKRCELLLERVVDCLKDK